MKEIDLPMISISTGLESAMSELRRSKRSALVSEDEGVFHLFTAPGIAAARAQGIETLLALKAHPTLMPIIVVGTVRQPGRGARAIRIRPAISAGGQTRAKAKVEFPRLTGQRYLVTKIGAKKVFLGVGNENIASIFVSSPAAYYCSRPVRPHSFSPGQVQVGDPCPTLDGYVIVSC